ncbi:hypothetical protein HDF16_005999 [Granulicella aggregans]|uniref:Uncharacterized protein n=1 Tax=Granulicella aggregans TaxID=474949 RepID=A0A7W8E6J0_9BACT|nr:hypothetical protein [Granulicella aggregans]MBB5061263.1 hypothetical protein [Granulicella aggregans]
MNTDNAWQPTATQIESAESHLSQIIGLHTQWLGDTRVIDNPGGYYRQYVPIQLDGKKLLFVNAFCDRGLTADWRSRLVDVSDGGECYWKATYDPVTERYSDLAINGKG